MSDPSVQNTEIFDIKVGSITDVNMPIETDKSVAKSSNIFIDNEILFPGKPSQSFEDNEAAVIKRAKNVSEGAYRQKPQQFDTFQNSQGFILMSDENDNNLENFKIQYDQKIRKSQQHQTRNTNQFIISSGSPDHMSSPLKSQSRSKIPRKIKKMTKDKMLSSKDNTKQFANQDEAGIRKKEKRSAKSKTPNKQRRPAAITADNSMVANNYASVKNLGHTRPKTPPEERVAIIKPASHIMAVSSELNTRRLISKDKNAKSHVDLHPLQGAVFRPAHTQYQNSLHHTGWGQSSATLINSMIDPRDSSIREHENSTQGTEQLHKKRSSAFKQNKNLLDAKDKMAQAYSMSSQSPQRIRKSASGVKISNLYKLQNNFKESFGRNQSAKHGRWTKDQPQIDQNQISYFTQPDNTMQYTARPVNAPTLEKPDRNKLSRIRPKRSNVKKMQLSLQNVNGLDDIADITTAAKRDTPITTRDKKQYGPKLAKKAKDIEKTQHSLIEQIIIAKSKMSNAVHQALQEKEAVTQMKSRVEELHEDNMNKENLIEELLKTTYALSQAMEGKGPLASFGIDVNPQYVFPEGLRNLPKDGKLMKYIYDNFIDIGPEPFNTVTQIKSENQSLQKLLNVNREELLQLQQSLESAQLRVNNDRIREKSAKTRKMRDIAESLLVILMNNNLEGEIEKNKQLLEFVQTVNTEKGARRDRNASAYSKKSRSSDHGSILGSFGMKTPGAGLDFEIADLNKKIKILEQKLEQKDEICEMQKKDYEMQLSMIESLQMINEQKDMTIKDLRNRISSSEEFQTKYTPILQTHRSKTSSLTHNKTPRKKASPKKVSKQTSIQSNYNMTHKHLHNKIDELNEKHAKILNQIEFITKEKDLLKVENETLISQKQQLIADKDTEVKENQDLQNEKVELNKIIEKLESEKGELLSKNKKNSKQCQDNLKSDGELSQLQKQIETLKIEKEKAMKQNWTLAQKVEDCQDSQIKQYENYIKDIRDKQKAIDRLNERQYETQRKISEVREESVRQRASSLKKKVNIRIVDDGSLGNDFAILNNNPNHEVSILPSQNQKARSYTVKQPKATPNFPEEGIILKHEKYNKERRQTHM